jgi:hypothetical protein
LGLSQLLDYQISALVPSSLGSANDVQQYGMIAFVLVTSCLVFAALTINRAMTAVSLAILLALVLAAARARYAQGVLFVTILIVCSYALLGQLTRGMAQKYIMPGMETPLLSLLLVKGKADAKDGAANKVKLSSGPAPSSSTTKQKNSSYAEPHAVGFFSSTIGLFVMAITELTDLSRSTTTAVTPFIAPWLIMTGIGNLVAGQISYRRCEAYYGSVFHAMAMWLLVHGCANAMDCSSFGLSIPTCSGRTALALTSISLFIAYVIAFIVALTINYAVSLAMAATAASFFLGTQLSSTIYQARICV